MESDCKARASGKTSTNELAVMKETSAEVKNMKGKFFFHWGQEIPDYGNKMLKRLNEFRKKEKFCDVTIKTNDAIFKAHKAVLAACGGIFRSFSEELSISNPSEQNTELQLICPAVGLQSILSFAYTGKLEITFQTLLPVYLAAIATETKEIQSVCLELCMTRLGWILHFDGTDETLSYVAKSTKASTIEEKCPTLDEAFEMLQYILLINSETFDSNEANVENVCYPCAKVIDERWPEFKNVYIGVVNCLIQARVIENSKNERTLESEKANGQQQAEPTGRPQSKIVDENKMEVSKTENFNVNMNVNNGEKKLFPVDTKQNDVSTTNGTFTSENSEKQIPPITVVPCGTVEIASHPARRKPTKSAPPIPSNRSVSPNPRIRSATKSPAPVVPPAPHKALSKSISNSQTPNRSTRNLNDDKPTIKNSSRLPPPRPKPPCIQKKKTKEIVPKNYDDTLNPFSNKPN